MKKKRRKVKSKKVVKKKVKRGTQEFTTPTPEDGVYRYVLEYHMPGVEPVKESSVVPAAEAKVIDWKAEVENFEATRKQAEDFDHALNLIVAFGLGAFVSLIGCAIVELLSK